MDLDKPRRRRKLQRFTAPRRAAFLEFLRKSGNYNAAAAAVGIDRSTAEQRRRRDADFAICCREALAEADRALAGADGAFDAAGQGAFDVIKKSRSGHTQLIRAGAKRWSRAIEAQYFAALAACGNLAAAARAVGFSESCIAQRRRKWPAFQRRLEEALEEAELNIEFRLASMGCDLAAAARDWPGAGEDPSTALGTGETGPLPFDADLALRFLKWREAKRTGPTGRRARWQKPPRALDEVKQSILKKLNAIHRHDRAQKLAAGWSEDEEGRLIPPGWVRVTGPPAEGLADEAGEAEPERKGDPGSGPG